MLNSVCYKEKLRAEFSNGPKQERLWALITVENKFSLYDTGKIREFYDKW